ncbi:DUF4388 domain-containing protein [Pseudanabaena sp. FACHB-2040]|uniref:DUF4388 domain-containing protein n=1 Tax=Pseudanabaena sp. FACHB-2040 TaxID=2692859 RepID=UPI0016847678|nr:DUF4388 domain-containing protein [Pseudanabaena sp. FACHB-2040]MBD2259726.1 DUF4388 domain-containing protein [Pseudanabaena sp. FACHB-2040]
MAITGHLAEFSLAEIFQFLEQGHKSGLLTVTPLPEPVGADAPRTYYIWLHQGRIVGAANRSDQRGLMTLISQRGWLGDRAATRLAQSCSLSAPIGLCFKSQGWLQADQLKLLFYVQVMQQVCALFTHEDGWFHFDSGSQAPAMELTGLSAPAVEVTLSGLRALKNWASLEDKLPDPASCLVAAIEGKPSLKLNQIEWQVWEFTDGKTPLKVIAQHLQQPIDKIQKVAFRLSLVNLVEEVPMVAMPPAAEPQTVPQAEPAAEAEPSNNLSQSFLQNLLSFLTGQS